MAKKTTNAISFALNLFIVIIMIYCVVTFFTEGTQGNMIASGWKAFKYYTIESNVLLALTSLIVLVFNIKGFKSGALELPSWALILKFVGTVAVTVTFTVVMVFLGPTVGYPEMFEGANIFMHCLNAVIANICFLVFERGFCFPKSKMKWGDSTVLLYGTFYFIMVVIVKAWNDFYGFNTVLKWWISFPAMIALGYLLSYIIWKLYTLNIRKNSP